MGALSREMSITYGEYTVGGDQAARILHDVYMVEQDYEKAVVEFTFTIVATTRDNFVSEVAVAQAAFRKPRQNITIRQDGKTLEGYAHDASSGFNGMPRIIKQRDISGGFARKYLVRVEFGLPADNVSTSFRRYSFVNVNYSPARQRTVTISGTYTANGTISSRTQYETVFDAYAASVLADLTGTFKKLEEPQSTHDDQNKELNFSCTFEEIIFTGIGSGDASLRGERFTVARSRSASGDSPLTTGEGIEKLTTLSVTYEAWFDKGSTTNLKTKWDGLRASTISQAKLLFNGGAVALIDETPRFDKTANHLTVQLTLQGVSTTSLIEYRVTSDTERVSGNNLVGVLSGDPLEKYDFVGPGNFIRTITQSFEIVGTESDVPEFPAAFTAAPDGLSAKQMYTKDTVTPVRRGITPYGLDSVVGVRILRLEFYKPIAAGPASGPDVGGPSEGLIDSIIETALGIVGGIGTGGSPPGGGGEP